MFKDCKTGGYNLEDTRVNKKRLLATILLITIASTLATFSGFSCRNIKTCDYISRPTEKHRSIPRHSDFWIGLYGFLWVESMKLWSDLATRLMNFKPHKRFYFQKGLYALSLIQSAL